MYKPSRRAAALLSQLHYANAIGVWADKTKRMPRSLRELLNQRLVADSGASAATFGDCVLVTVRPTDRGRFVLAWYEHSDRSPNCMCSECRPDRRFKTPQ